jgi:hypothetical protein
MKFEEWFSETFNVKSNTVSNWRFYLKELEEAYKAGYVAVSIDSSKNDLC